MKRSISSVLALGALAALLGSATAARADTLFNNFGAGDSYDTIQSWLVGGDNVFREDIAGGISTGANAYDNIVFEGAFGYGGGTNGLIFELHANSGGVPGGVLATSSVMNASSNGPSILTWALDPSVTLAAGSDYWFSARANSADGVIGWYWNNTGSNGFAFYQDGTDWLPYGDTSPAFRVSGSVVGANNVVPEPGAWATMGVIGMGLGGLIVRKRRRS